MSVFGLTVDKRAVCFFNGTATKHDALDALVDAVALVGNVTDVETFRRAVREREAVMSTGIGSGVAIPHVRIDVVQNPTMGVGISHTGIDFNTLDNKPVNIIVLFAMPAGSQKEYLALLAKVMTAMKEPGFRDRLGACTTADEVAEVLNDAA